MTRKRTRPKDEVPPQSSHLRSSSRPSWKMKVHFRLTTCEYQSQPPFLKFLGSDALRIVNHIFPKLLRNGNALKATDATIEALSTFKEFCQRNPVINVKAFNKFSVYQSPCTGDMEERYKDLQRQFDKTGIVEPERTAVINLKFISAINDPFLREIVNILKNPTFEDILKENAILQNDIQEVKILCENMSSMQQMDLAFTNHKMTIILAAVISDSQNFVFDDAILCKYPISSHSYFYKILCESVNKITLSGVSENDYTKLQKHWKRIDTLEMRNMEILGKGGELRFSLSKLTILNSFINTPYLEKLIQIVANGSLHLENVTVKFIGDTDNSSSNIWVKNLENMTLIGDSATLFRSFGKMFQTQKLKNVKIVTKEEFEDFNLDCDNLYYDGPPMCIHLDQPTKNLTVRSWGGCYLPEQSRLQTTTITILDPVQFFYKKEIEVLARHCLVNATFEEDPNPNLIIDALNEYCIWKIGEYLEREDLLMFAQTHSKIYNILQRSFYTTVEIGHTFKSVYKSLLKNAHHTRSLCISQKSCNGRVERGMTRLTFLPLLKYFTNVTDLKLYSLYTKKSHCNVFQELRLQELTVVDCEPMDQSAWTNFLQKVNPTLRYLNWKTGGDFDLMNFTNLKKFTVYADIFGEHLEEFLRSNGHFLEEIEIYEIFDYYRSDAVWQLLGMLPNLYQLTIISHGAFLDIPDPLDIEYNERMSLHLDNIRQLTLNFSDSRLKFLPNWIHFTKLEELYIIDLLEMEKRLIEQLVIFTNLQKLCIRSISPYDWFTDGLADTIIPLLTSLRLLKTIEMPLVSTNPFFKQNLEEFLKENQRQLKLNGIYFNKLD